MSSLNYNHTVADIDINNTATYWLWAVFAIMLLSDLIFIAWSLRRPVGTRTFHQLPVLILTTAAIAYFSMASDLGATAVVAEYPRGRAYGVTRSIWYVRYIDWTITTPLLLLELLLNTGLPLSDILTVVFFDLAMIVCGLVGSLVASRYKWGYFAFGCAAQFYIWWILIFKGRAASRALGNDVGKAYTTSAIFLSVIWLLYPIAWGVSDGGNVISPLYEMVFYGILDVLAKPVFCFLHANALRNIPYERFLLQSGKASMAANVAGGLAAHDGKEARYSTASGAPLAPGEGAAGMASVAPSNAGPHTTTGGPLNGRNGLTHRESGRGNAEMGTTGAATRQL